MHFKEKKTLRFIVCICGPWKNIICNNLSLFFLNINIAKMKAINQILEIPSQDRGNTKTTL